MVTKDVVYMTADQEDEFIVAQANEPLDEEGHFVHSKVNGRHRDEFVEVPASQADYMDISPRMVVSVATAMIPVSYTHLDVYKRQDHYAVACYQELFIPKAWNLGLGH